MLSIYEIIRYIVVNSKENLLPRKLQILAYYTNAWHLAWEDKPLFKEDFIADDSGPINYEVLNLQKDPFTVDKDFLGHISIENTFKPNEIETITRVLAFYENKSSQYLKELVTKELPYIKARNTENKIIDKNIIRQYYKSLI